MLFSVVILSYNSARTLKTCLSTLNKTLSTYNEESEILVFENGSKDGSVDILNNFKTTPGIDLCAHYSDENKGTTVSRNTLLNKAKGAYVLVLDSDAYIGPEALDKLKSTLDADKSIGMAVPKLFYGDGRFQLSTDKFPTLFRKVQRFLSLDSMQGNIKPDSLQDQDVDYAISACWLLRKDAVDAVGGFDEAIFYSPEDVDYCMQVWSKGYRIHYVVGSEVIHDAQELSRGFKISFFHFSHLKGLFYLFAKYRYFFGLNGLYRRMGRK
jgi:GT2 family glycosyltransferase